MQNQPSAADATDLPKTPQGGADAAWAQVASDLKTVQQQALATQRAIGQLQAQQDAPSHANVWPVSMTLSGGGWSVLAALVLVAVAWLAWRSRRRPTAPQASAPSDAVTSAFADDLSSMMALQQPVQEDDVSQWAAATETEDDLDIDWGANPLVRPDPATMFDLEAATNEVTRVRKTLAERRHERTLQMERDARLRRESAERAEEAALATKLQAVPHRGSWVPDLDLSQDIAAHEPSATLVVPEPQPFIEPLVETVLAPQPPQPLAPLEEPPMNTYTLEPDPVETLLPAQEPFASQPPAPTREPDTTPHDAYAVKLALAHESEAIELWDEAHDLAEEVLASPDAALRAQAQATLQRLAVKMRSEEQGAQPVAAVSAPLPAPVPALDVPQIPEPPTAPQEDVYAVKLALAHESEAVELWEEARELAEEVLASPDSALIAQAQALLAEIQQKLDASAQDSLPFDPALDAPRPVGR